MTTKTPCHGLPGVHGHENADTGVDVDFSTGANIHRCLGKVQRVLNGAQLRRNYGQHFDVNTVELIEAAPRADLRTHVTSHRYQQVNIGMERNRNTIIRMHAA